jgi:hypothetical protein
MENMTEKEQDIFNQLLKVDMIDYMDFMDGEVSFNSLSPFVKRKLKRYSVRFTKTGACEHQIDLYHSPKMLKNMAKEMAKRM